ncbi:hypothetical protein N0V90_005399 [Kalmusia sp. IMI 367209]|nr:hypothetical protein N0V90_005399 [Kalmusia sp. IMI 367209]
MWLIDTTTLRLKQIIEPEIEYAILSHTWEDGEVTFQEFADLEKAEMKPGFGKIAKTCKLAKLRGLKWAWVDTVCIDKTSSAELTEAINSMFQWYKRAVVCFTWISDLSPVPSGGALLDWIFEKDYRWFSRGWTLQELIAPRSLEFYDSDWHFRGLKHTLRFKLSQITGIDAEALEDSSILAAIPVARKFSWASNRKTTRVEDIAYCLLGIFDVNMPMIYGEGQRAFVRLQEEISKETNDPSLFAWTSQNGDAQSPHTYRGALAQTPREFADCQNIVRYRNYLAPGTEFAITNNGIKMETNLGLSANKEFVLNLDCLVKERPGIQYPSLGIYVRRTVSGFVRQHPEKLFVTHDPSIWGEQRVTVQIRKLLNMEESRQIDRELGSRFYIDYNTTDSHSVDDMVSSPMVLWDSQGNYFLTMESATTAIANSIYPQFTGFKGFNIKFQGVHACSCLLVCGIFMDSQGRPRPLAVVYTDKDPSTRDVFETIRSNKEAGSSRLLNQLRNFVLSKHAPEGGTLTWNHICNRIVKVRTARDHWVRIHIAITLIVTEQRENDNSNGMYQHGTRIEFLPDEFFTSASNQGYRRYKITVHLEGRSS